MITLTENLDNVDAISADATTREIIRITASDDAGGERLDRFLAAAIAAHNSEDGASADSHSLSRSRIKALVLSGCLRENETIITDPSAAIKAGAIYQLSVPKPSDPKPQGEAIA